MKKAVRTAPPHSLVLVSDATISAIPETMGGSSIASSESCVAVGTLSEHDGQTRIQLVDDQETCPIGELRFDALLPTPSGLVSVRSVHGEVILELSVTAGATRVRIWTNDENEPDDISIVLGGG